MFNRPALSVLADRARSDLTARLPGADSRLRRSVLDVLARTHAGATHGAYGYLDWISRQVLPDTADTEVLERWASLFGVARLAATAATGSVTLIGVTGSVVPVATALQRGDGVEYRTTAAATLVGGVAVAQIEAVVASAAGRAAAGAVLTLVSPVAGVSSQGAVSADMTGGTDEEADDALRARLLERLREPPAGGAEHDYRRWAREAGVARAWVYPLMNGLGTVGLTFVIEGRVDQIPNLADVVAVAAYIEARRPVGAEVEVFAPTPKPLNLTIALFPDTAAIRVAVQAEIDDLLARDAEPGGTLLISRIREAVSIAAGESDNAVISPTANVAHAPGELAVPGVTTWAG